MICGSDIDEHSNWATLISSEALVIMGADVLARSGAS
jgi:hypothetical protein